MHIRHEEPTPTLTEERPPTLATEPRRAANPVLLAAVALPAAFAVLFAVWLLARPLALLFAAVVIANALSPLAALLERKLPHVLAVVVAYLALLAVVGGILRLVVPPLIEQANGATSSAPALIERARVEFGRLDALGGGRLGEAVQSAAAGLSGRALALPFTVLSVALEAVIVLITSAYWLISTPALSRFALSLLPERARPEAARVLHELSHTVGGYIRGTVIDGLILGAVMYLGYRLIGLQFPLVLALLAGLSTLVPIVGPAIAATSALTLAFLDSPSKAAWVLAFYCAVELLESYVLLPSILSEQADIPPVLVMFALFAGASVGGLLGAVLAIPFAGAVRILVLRVGAPAIRRRTGAPPLQHGGDGAKAKGERDGSS